MSREKQIQRASVISVKPHIASQKKKSLRKRKIPSKAERGHNATSEMMLFVRVWEGFDKVFVESEGSPGGH